MTLQDQKASSPSARPRNSPLTPLDGVRTLAALSVALQHIGLQFGLASTAWTWYKVLDEHYWPNVVQGPQSQLGMIAFFIITGILAASSLIPALEKHSDFQVATAYYQRRARKLLPAYLCSLAVMALITLCFKADGGSHAYAKGISSYFAFKDLRRAFVDLTCSTNLVWRCGILSYQWNLSSQVQFYAAFPLALLALQPTRPGFRKRTAVASVFVMVFAIGFRAAMAHHHGLTIPFSLYAMEEFNVGGSGGHDPRHVEMAGQFFYGVHATLAARSFDFAAGVLIYLIASSPTAAQQLKARSRVCTTAGVLVLVLDTLACLSGDKAYSGEAFPSAPPAASYTVHIFVIGLWCPMTVAWLILYILTQPDALSRNLARVLSCKSFHFGSDISMSFWMLNWPVIALMLYLAPGSWVPLSSFGIFVKFAAVSVSVTVALAWLQDQALARLGPAGWARLDLASSSIGLQFQKELD